MWTNYYDETIFSLTYAALLGKIYLNQLRAQRYRLLAHLK
ncbi:MAG: hypothetical protein ACJA2Q_000826 [Pseudohongiellaceae bacterium]|jgi:hypothetical protein